MTLLEIKDLMVAIGGITVLDDVNLSLGKGQRLGVIGASASGKSVLALAVAGLLPRRAVQSGSLRFEDAPLEPQKLRGRRIGMLFQPGTIELDPLRTAGEQIILALANAGQAGDMTPLLAEAGLSATLVDRLPRDLTVAEQQRVLLAIALAGQPSLLIADMPGWGLEATAQKAMLDLIDRVCAARGMALLLLAADLRMIAALCSTIVVLAGGKVIEAGDKAEVFGHPRHDHTKLLMAAGRQRARTLMRAPIGGPLLEVRNLSRRYRQPDRSPVEPSPPVQALDGVSFSLREGEAFGLTGPAGSGKSTLARIIVGLERASSGEVAFDGTAYHGADMPHALRADIGFVSGDPAQSFNPRLTVGESIAERLRLSADEPMDVLGARIVEVMTAVGLAPDMLERLPREFLVTDLQRLALARALITRPRLVVLDDPMARLDIGGRGELPVLLNRLRADFGLTLLLVAHDLDMLRLTTDRVAVLERGRIVETGSPAQLLEAPQHKLTQELVAARLPEIGIVPVF